MERHPFWRLYLVGLTIIVVFALVGCDETGRAPTVHDLTYPNPDEFPGIIGFHRFAVEWRVVKRGEPIPCGSLDWAGGCSSFDEKRNTCTVYAEDPLAYDWGTERDDHEARLAILGHEILHCVYYSFHAKSRERLT